MEELLQQFAGYFSISVNLLLLLVGTIVILLFLNIVAFLKIGSFKKKYNKFMAGEDGKSLEETILKQKDEIESLMSTVKEKEEIISKIYNLLEQTYSKMGLVKYDALNNMSGKISFAFVLLNAENNGFLMNSIHTRNGSYVYLRDIKNGTCDVKLGDEEIQALQMALNS